MKKEYNSTAKKPVKRSFLDARIIPTIWETVSTREAKWLSISKTVRYKQCQSCGMPMKMDRIRRRDFDKKSHVVSIQQSCGKKWGGSEKDGTLSKMYCSSCYQQGKFTRPDITVQEMQKLVDNVLKREMKWRRLFRRLAVRQIPSLARRKNK